MTAAYAKRRARHEPVVEITQIKGDSESHPFLVTNTMNLRALALLAGNSTIRRAARPRQDRGACAGGGVRRARAAPAARHRPARPGRSRAPRRPSAARARPSSARFASSTLTCAGGATRCCAAALATARRTEVMMSPATYGGSRSRGRTRRRRGRSPRRASRRRRGRRGCVRRGRVRRSTLCRRSGSARVDVCYQRVVYAWTWFRKDVGEGVVMREARSAATRGRRAPRGRAC